MTEQSLHNISATLKYGHPIEFVNSSPSLSHNNNLYTTFGHVY